MPKEVDTLSAASVGSPEPVGFAVMSEKGRWEATRETLESAEELAVAFSEDQECGFGRCHVVPLYRKPMLAGEELKAIRRAAAVAREMHDSRLEAALGNLLKRLG